MDDRAWKDARRSRRVGPLAGGVLALWLAHPALAVDGVIEINHSRIFSRLPAKDTMIEVECEARDAKAIDDVVARLEAVGFVVERASLD